MEEGAICEKDRTYNFPLFENWAKRIIRATWPKQEANQDLHS